MPGAAARKDQGGLGLHGTFSPNKIESVHRWYPYLEGFSSTFVEEVTDRWASGPIDTTYDPFAGTGTSVTVAVARGQKALYSEINPFMRHVVECKTNVLRRVADRSMELASYFSEVQDRAITLVKTEAEAEAELFQSFPGRKYFKGHRLVEILSLRSALHSLDAEDDFKMLGKLALASIGVPSSEMKRQSDLRYRTSKELLSEDYSVFDAFKSKSNQISEDVATGYAQLSESVLASPNAISVTKHEGSVDFVVTSPPYLNGTNYFRNTKIELWLTGYIAHESELNGLNQQAMIAGINNVNKFSRESTVFDFVETVAKKLDQVSYDRRIPALVRGYCSDTELWIKSTVRMMRKGARLVIDIGDSRFAGVHVPTDEFILYIAKGLGLTHIDSEWVRSRKSKDGAALKQVLLILEKDFE
jgi:hypothetical protein